MSPINRKPQKNRQGMPSGYVVGRTDSGTGHEQLISIDELAQQIAQGNNSVAAGASAIAGLHEFLGFTARGTFASDQVFTLAAAPRTTTFPAAAPADTASCGFVGTNAHTKLYLVNDLPNFLADGATGLICTVDFAAGATLATITYNGTVVVTAGQVLHMVCDHTADATLAEVSINFSGDPS